MTTLPVMEQCIKMLALELWEFVMGSIHVGDCIYKKSLCHAKSY